MSGVHLDPVNLHKENLEQGKVKYTTLTQTAGGALRVFYPRR